MTSDELHGPRKHGANPTAVVIGLDLPDASDSRTLTDFADIETARIFENLFYLGAAGRRTLHLAESDDTTEPTRSGDDDA